MEDGQSEVAPGSNSAPPESRLSGDLPSATGVDNMDIEKQSESFEGVDEGEIMVEVLGTAVFVDGVSNLQEGNLGSGEVEGLAGTVLEERQEQGDSVASGEKDVLVEESGDKMLYCGVHFSEPRDEKDCITASGEAGALLSKEDSILNEKLNQVATPADVSLASETDGIVIPEGEIGKEVVYSDHMEADADEKFDLVDGQEILFTTSAANSENVDLVVADTPLLSEAIAVVDGLQTAPSGSTEIVGFDDVLDFEIGSSNVSADLSSMSKDKSLSSDVKCVADKVNHADILENCTGADEASESKMPIQYHNEETACEKNEADSSKSNGIFYDEGKSTKEFEGEYVFDSLHPDINSEALIEECAPEEEQYHSPDEDNYITVSSLKMGQSGYLSAPEKEGRFAVGDLVWGKVRSHPWWPGQIFDPADASDEATKYYKKDSHLVAYFGDQTFGWNESSLLKPFRPYFSQMVRQSNSQAFRDAIDCALEEVSRRIQLGLSCSCMPQDEYFKIKSQCITNSGIRQSSNERCGVDKSCEAQHFQPAELLLFIQELAPHSAFGADRLDLVLTQAQLSALCHFKGYPLPPELVEFEELLENDIGTAQKNLQHTPVDASESLRERSLSDLMDLEFSVDVESDSFPDDVGISVSFPVSRKRKADYPLGDGVEKRLSTHAARISTPTSQAPKASFKIGECISRVASKLTAPGSDDSHKMFELDRPTMVVSAESSSLEEMLSQIQLLACHPNKEHSFPLTTHTFLLGLRNSIALSRRGRRKGSETASGEAAEEFEFHDVNDSYWTDRIVQNNSPEQVNNGDNSASTLEMAQYVAESVVKPGRKSRKRFSTGSLPSLAATPEQDETSKKQKQQSSPAELTLNFEDRKRVPSEISLNKIFRRFGALMESETEVDHASGRARVIFKRGFDAEVACDSSKKFNLFGPATVSYEVGYSPLISVKIPPIAPPQPVGDETWMPNAVA